MKPVHIAVMQSNQPVDPAFAEDLLPEVELFEGIPSPPSGCPFIQCKHPLLGIVQGSWQERHSSLESAVAISHQRLTEDESADLKTALILLDRISQHLFSGRMHSVFRTVITWAAVIPQGYLDMVIRGSPVALVIYSHWLILTILLENHWWVADMGKQLADDSCRKYPCGTLSDGSMIR